VAANSDTSEISNRCGASRTPTSLASSSLILLVEPEPIFRVSCAHELLDEGYELVESESASEAMGILGRRNDFDAMITDIDEEQVPGGLGLVRYAASRHPGMRILVGSACIEAEAELGAINADYLAKPYPACSLVRSVRAIFDQGLP
jgi:two-component system, response regulator PdtaR